MPPCARSSSRPVSACRWNPSASIRRWDRAPHRASCPPSGATWRSAAGAPSRADPATTSAADPHPPVPEPTPERIPRPGPDDAPPASARKRPGEERKCAGGCASRAVLRPGSSPTPSRAAAESRGCSSRPGGEPLAALGQPRAGRSSAASPAARAVRRRRARGARWGRGQRRTSAEAARRAGAGA